VRLYPRHSASAAESSEWTEWSRALLPATVDTLCSGFLEFLPLLSLPRTLFDLLH